MNRAAHLTGLFALALGAHAQVVVTTPIELTGTLEERRIDGIAAPVQGDAAITVEGSLISGGYAWCTAALNANTLSLQAQPTLDAYRDGLLLRFRVPSNVTGELNVQVDGLAPAPLRRPDGLAITPGQLTTGVIAEVLYANGGFVLLNATEKGCPPGFLQAHARLCMEATATPKMLFPNAVDRCADLGATLCTWDEYIAGCTILENQLSNLFADWEWLDESSNHAHGADQAGRLTCVSQRHISPVPTFVSSARCCYRPR